VKQAASLPPAWLILRPWRWRQRVPPKRPFVFNGIHGVISQKTELFITIVVRTSNPTILREFSSCTTFKNWSQILTVTYILLVQKLLCPWCITSKLKEHAESSSEMWLISAILVRYYTQKNLQWIRSATRILSQNIITLCTTTSIHDCSDSSKPWSFHIF
jgi:hypothetical protein